MREDMQDAFFADYLDRLGNLQRSLHAAVQDLPAAAMDWAPGPEMNSIAVLLAHTTGSLRYWIGDVALGDPSSRVREREFQTRGLSSAEMLRSLDAVMDYTRSALPRLSLEDLPKKRALEKETVTYSWALLHALEHASLHLGHIQLTSQLWKQFHSHQ
jgi:uncharacterized damage-inducible protein DinB